MCILNPDTSNEYVAELDDKYAHLRAEKENENAPLVSLEEARKRKPKLF